MSFTKKTWITAEVIPATELNRIETGIDDAYDQDTEFIGTKLFENDLYIKNAEQVDKALYLLYSSVKSGEIKAHASYGAIIKDLVGSGIRFKDIAGTVGILAGSWNGVVPESHFSRHRRAGVDAVCITPDIIIDAAGKGDYATVQAALSACVGGEAVLVKNGTYSPGVNLNIPSSVHLYGQSREDTIINLTATQKLLLSNNYGKLSNITVQKLTGGSTGSLVDVTANRCSLCDVNVVNNYGHGVYIFTGTGYNKMQGCNINADIASGSLYPLWIRGINHIIVGNNIHGGSTNVDDVVYIEGSRHVIAANKISGLNAVNVGGITIDGSYIRAFANIIADTYYPGNVAGSYNIFHGNLADYATNNFIDSGVGNIVTDNKKV